MPGNEHIGYDVPCDRRDELVADVQRHLMELADLARQEADVLGRNQNELLMPIDKQIEETLGEKERALGALKQHRNDHGC